jgi:hypothetical protein
MSQWASTTSMSIPRLDSGLPSAPDAAGAGDPFDTALIARLANELFSGSHRPAPAFPETSGIPAAVPAIPTDAPTAPSAVAGIPSAVPGAPAGFPGVPAAPNLDAGIPGLPTSFPTAPTAIAGAPIALPGLPANNLGAPGAFPETHCADRIMIAAWQVDTDRLLRPPIHRCIPSWNPPIRKSLTAARRPTPRPPFGSARSGFSGCPRIRRAALQRHSVRRFHSADGQPRPRRKLPPQPSRAESPRLRPPVRPSPGWN